MNTQEKLPWLTFIEHDCLFGTWHGELRVIEVVLKVRHTGLMAVVKVEIGGQRMVGFTGAGGLKSLSRKVRDILANPETRWSPDKFA